MERTGVVKAVDGKWLEIEFCRPKDCEKCNACHGGQKVMSLRIEGKARVGDQVVVSLPQSTITMASLIVYVIPAAGLFLGMILGEKLLPEHNSLGAMLGGLIGVSIPGLALYLTERRRKADPRWTPQLVRVIPCNTNDTTDK